LNQALTKKQLVTLLKLMAKKEQNIGAHFALNGFSFFEGP
jgi:hypothetical protein